MRKGRAKTSQNSDAFAQAVERALEHAGDAAWLGVHSPLAAPYFIGAALDESREADTPAGRGRALLAAMRAAAESLPEDQLRLLSVSFFDRRASQTNAGVAQALNMSEATYYRHRSAAIEALSAALNRNLVPPLRQAIPRARPLVGRAQLVDDCLMALRERRSVAVTGAGGLGKTSLGAHVAARWPPERAFWYTVRPGLNDHLSSFAFSLGHFLRRHGAANTWRQLVADRGSLDAARVLGLLRHDLAAVADPPVLVCVDETDLLRPELLGHAQVTHILEELNTSAPLLLLGQQPVAADRHVVLGGLPAEAVTELLAQEGVADLSAGDIAQLCAATRGNPALIVLFATLHREGERLADVLPQLANAPSVEVLLGRMWQRLNDGERDMLAMLAVFREAAPADAWSADAMELERLQARGLVLLDGRGGIDVPAHVREFVLRRTPPDVRHTNHLAAGKLREARGEYTAAARHYLAGRQPALAVWTLFAHRELETARGQAPSAREMLAEISLSELTDEQDRRALALLKAEHALMLGAADEADRALGAVSWPAHHPAAPYARQILGDVRQMQGRIEQALDAYRESLDLLPQPRERRVVQLRSKIGYIYVTRLRDLEEARREGALALWQAQIFQGYVEEESGHYPAARRHYEAALEIAAGLADGRLAESRTHGYLGHLSWREGDAAAAVRHLERAIADAQALGEPVSVTYNRLNLAGAYIVAGRYAEALAEAEAGLSLAEPMQHAFLIAGLTASAGEACYFLGRLDQAERYAMRSLREEEEVHRPYALTVLGWVRAAQGNLSEAESMLHMAIEAARTAQDRYAEAPAWKALGRVHAAAGRRDAALDAYEHARALYMALALHGEADAVQADADQLP